jgi:hypothetical protein
MMNDELSGSEQRLSWAILGVQILLVLGGIAAVFLPFVGAGVAVLGFTLYWLGQRREKVRERQLLSDIDQKMEDLDSSVTIDGKPVTYSAGPADSRETPRNRSRLDRS